MSFLIAAAGTGGHVFPGLAVAESLIEQGVAKDSVLFVGGDRLEADVYPGHGFDFLGLELRGLKRSMSPSNLSLPRVVLRARGRIREEIRGRAIGVVLGMGGYVTIPAAMAASSESTTLMVAEQNAGAGLANRIAARWAERTFVAFPRTRGLETGEWVGNPVRRSISRLDRDAVRDDALSHFDLVPDVPVVGVFGGSLGAGAINMAVAEMASSWSGPALQILHLSGESHVEALAGLPSQASVRWRRKGFEERMDLFYAASDLVVARAGGAVAEITATASPSILVPGEFGSAGHQNANAAFLADEGAAVVVAQADLSSLEGVVAGILGDPDRLPAMSKAASRIAKPEAAKDIARAMIDSAA